VDFKAWDVAPRAGAWIETIPNSPARRHRVASHPVRVRGLKRLPIENAIKQAESHPVRVRGLKHQRF